MQEPAALRCHRLGLLRASDLKRDDGLGVYPDERWRLGAEREPHGRLLSSPSHAQAILILITRELRELKAARERARVKVRQLRALIMADMPALRALAS